MAHSWFPAAARRWQPRGVRRHGPVPGFRDSGIGSGAVGGFRVVYGSDPARFGSAMAHSAPLGLLEQGCPIQVEHDRKRRQFTVRLNGKGLRGEGGTGLPGTLPALLCPRFYLPGGSQPPISPHFPPAQLCNKKPSTLPQCPCAPPHTLLSPPGPSPVPPVPAGAPHPSCPPPPKSWLRRSGGLSAGAGVWSPTLAWAGLGGHTHYLGHPPPPRRRWVWMMWRCCARLVLGTCLGVRAAGWVFWWDSCREAPQGGGEWPPGALAPWVLGIWFGRTQGTEPSCPRHPWDRGCGGLVTR